MSSQKGHRDRGGADAGSWRGHGVEQARGELGGGKVRGAGGWGSECEGGLRVTGEGSEGREGSEGQEGGRSGRVKSGMAGWGHREREESE